MSIALAVHGGAGAIDAERIQERRAEFEHALHSALLAGGRVLESRGSAVDAVTEAVATLEDEPCFNAGRGSVLCSNGRVEMSATVVEGEMQQAGAVAALSQIKNPVRAARALLDHRHTVVLGAEAERWLIERYRLETEPLDWFITEPRREQWMRLRDRSNVTLDHDSNTVGAVARDSQGHVAAATSTGGMANQLPGRLSDSSIPGSGTWADNRTVAVSGTGDGDIFLRHAFARRVADLVELESVGAERACVTALAELAWLGGEGGCIALTSAGPPVMQMSTKGMFRGLLAENGQVFVGILRDEALHSPGAGLANIPA